MARVTVEDCLEHVENRFKLVLLASKRARQLALGTEPLVEWENDKPTVVALREIAENLVNEEMMQAFLAAPLEEEVEFDEDDFVAALHAEVSRELSQTVADPSNPKSQGPQVSQAQQPSPIANNPLFGSGFSSANNAGSAAANAQQSDSANTESTPATNAQESDSANTESSPPTTPPSDPTPEGEQGF